MTQVLIAGIPRSGTTWIAETLARTEGTAYIHEPDNEKLHPLAVKAKRGLGRFPLLDPRDAAPVYERLWHRAFAGGTPHPPTLRDVLSQRLSPLNRAGGRVVFLPSWRLRAAASLAPVTPRADVPRHVVVKSVHCALALPWIYERCKPRVITIFRHPFAVISSQIRMEMPDQDRQLDRHPSIRAWLRDRWEVDVPDTDASSVERAAWQVGVLMSALADFASRCPASITIVHEDAAGDPILHLRALCTRLEIRWTPAAETYLTEANLPGSGYQRRRVAAAEVDRWRTSLDAADRLAAARVLTSFPAVASMFEGIVRA